MVSAVLKELYSHTNRVTYMEVIDLLMNRDKKLPTLDVYLGNLQFMQILLTCIRSIEAMLYGNISFIHSTCNLCGVFHNAHLLLSYSELDWL